MRFPAFLIAAALVIAVSCMSSTPKPVPVLSTPSAPPKAESSKAAVPVVSSRMDPLTPPFTQSTLQGVYTDAEARAGSDVYKGYCASCHTPISHAGPDFRQHWAGKPLSGLYNLIKKTMPQNTPGSLDEYSYGVVLAYILKLNGMPAGKAPIMGDSVDLDKIRMDTVRAGPPGAIKSGR